MTCIGIFRALADANSSIKSSKLSDLGSSASIGYTQETHQYIDETGERYRLNHAIVVKFLFLYSIFP